MKGSYECDVATHIGPESCGAAREGGVEALTRERAGRVFSRVRNLLRDADAVRRCGRLHPVHRYREVCQSPAQSRDPIARREAPRTGTGRSQVRPGPQLPWAASGSLRTHADDERIWEVGQTYCTGEVPEQRRATGCGGDGGKRPGQGNPAPTETRPGHQAGEDALSAWVERVRQAAKQDKKLRFTALLHHIYDPERLSEAYFSLKKEAAPGVDGETWRHYGETLEDNLQDLSHRLKRGAYRASRCVGCIYPKADGRRRPAAGSNGAGGQNRPAGRGGRGVERYLRNGFSRILVWVPARAKPASSAGRALHGAADEESELGARCRHSRLLGSIYTMPPDS